MNDDKKQGIDIGMEYLKNLYSGTDLETKEAQPIYILYRDTIRTFLHEKIEEFGLSARFLGFLGIEISIITTLFTATFNDFLKIKANIIQGTFVAFAIIFALLIFKDIKCWWCNKENLTVDELAKELGQRGTIIKPPGNAADK